MRSLNRKESMALTLIQDRITRMQPCPSLTEIANATGARHRSSGHKLVEGLIRKGFVTRRGHGLRLIDIAPAPPPIAIVEKEVVRLVPEPVPVPPVSPHPPKDQAKMASTRRQRTYVVELEGDLHRQLRRLSADAGIPAEEIISQALRAWIMDLKEGG